MAKPHPALTDEAQTAPTTGARPNSYVTNDEGVTMLCNCFPDHAHRGVYATARLSASPRGTIYACDDCRADHARRAARLAEITAGARPTADTAAQRVQAWADAMKGRIAYGIDVHQSRSVSVGVADARALADHTSSPAQRDQLRAAVTTFLSHADGEPRTVAPSHGTRPPLFTYDMLVLLDQEPVDGDDDSLTCPNNNRPPECTEIDPCEACTQDADAEAAEIDASMGLHEATNGGARQGPLDTYEVTVFRTEMISFTLPAFSVRDAEERYLQDGEETGSETVKLSVDSIKRLDSQLT